VSIIVIHLPVKVRQALAQEGHSPVHLGGFNRCVSYRDVGLNRCIPYTDIERVGLIHKYVYVYVCEVIESQGCIGVYKCMYVYM
jgi:hypothetical protein